MKYVLVRYSEIGTKSNPVRRKMIHRLRQRVQERLEYEETSFESVRTIPGRIVVETSEPGEAADRLSEVPGVASVSPAIGTDPDIDDLREASEDFSYGDTFAVRTERAGEHGFNSKQVNEELGSHIESFSGSSVDLENPDTALGVDIRFDRAYLFTQKTEGPGGYPVGSQRPVAALISGGIDSPVAAYQAMKRGSPVLPVYFYNKPVAAEDHWLRFKSSVGKLKKYHPSLEWKAYRVDMEEVNSELMEIGRGRMLLHRLIMFSVAERIAEKEGLAGIVTGESLGQKSSQTAANLELTSGRTKKPIHRPLFSWNKDEITQKAREIGTFKDASIASACSSMAPESPATSMTEEAFSDLVKRVDIEDLEAKGFENAEKVRIQ